MRDAFADTDAERVTIGAALQGSDLVMDSLTEGDFLSPECRCVFRACRAARAEHLAADPATVAAKLGADTLEALGGAKWLTQCVRQVPTLANVDSYVQLVREYSRRRTFRDFCTSAVQSLGEANADDAIDALFSQLRTISGGKSVWATSGQVAAATYDLMAAIARGDIRTVPTGIAGIDGASAGGLRQGEMTVLAAGTGQGKSALALCVALNAARKGFTVGIVSREMSIEQYGMRAFASLTGIDSATMLRSKSMSGDQWAAVTEAVGELHRLPVDFSCTLSTVEDVARECKRKPKLELLIVDYLQILGTKARAADIRSQVSAVTRGLKLLAMDLHIPVLALSQFSRGVGDRMPTLSDLKESSSIEQDADNVWLMHRPKSGSEDCIPQGYTGWFEAAADMDSRLLVFDIAKQRMCPPGASCLIFDPAKMSFTTPQRA